MRPIKVLIVDDSLVIQRIFSTILAMDPEISVVGVASDPYEAREKIKILNPDVLTLDMEMPRMEGLTFIEKLMSLHPMPVIVVSSITRENCHISMRALELGALEVMTKPGVGQSFDEFGVDLIAKIKCAGLARKEKQDNKTDKSITWRREMMQANHINLIAIGGSTGATEVIRRIFSLLTPESLPPIVITQHLLSGFSETFAESLSKTSPFKIIEAADGEILKSGMAYLAPSDIHMEILLNQQAQFQVHLKQGERVQGHKPSVDVMFDSISKINAKRSLAILLTGMGADGAKGLLAIKNLGGVTIVQDQSSAVVWGMPRVATELNAVIHSLPTDGIAAAINDYTASKLKELADASLKKNE